MARKPLFIGIAVHKPRQMAQLPGVLEANRAMCQWAEKRYDVLSIDDANEPVTIRRLREIITPEDDDGDADPSLLLERPRIVVYFCGHGITAWPDQYWILSKGPDQSAERISANALRDILASYDPRQIALISDACRQAAPLHGAGNGVFDTLAGNYRNPQKDIFYSCRDGANSYAVPSAEGGPAYLVFTSVLLKALTKPDGTNLDRALLQLNRQAVTSQSLSDYLEENVPVKALAVDRAQAAQCDAGFRPFEHIYEEFAPLYGAPPDPDVGERLSEQPGQADDDTMPLPPPDRNDLPAIQDFVAKSFQAAEHSRMRRQSFRLETSLSDWRAPLVQRVGALLRDDGVYDESFVVLGSDRARLMFEDDRSRRLREFGRDLGINASAFTVRDKTERTICARLNYRAICLLPFYRNMHAIAVTSPARDGLQVELLSWISVYGDEDRPQLLNSAKALDALAKGNLRAVDAKRLAGQIRFAKHLDPMMGVIAGYLYNSAGDIDNIRRVAYYYADHGQPIPFDIAMLARLPLIDDNGGFRTHVPSVPQAENLEDGAPRFTLNRTRAAEGRVGGVSPILRAGWPYLRASSHPFHKICWKNIDRLGSSSISTFVGKRVSSEIANAFGEIFS
ncbi:MULTISPECIES: caspase family protein [Sinorhizobium]|uniref:caspase family protein n=1 Tax=Sinorhizobium TaxID=28105 RepID=UPI000BE80457|nr:MULTISPECIES: caspase family protein [Sinorhizobium]PDT50589.1 hypothetical protein CO664_25470 [Sinorhizobium sp. NG07B]POH33870.1 hypothetical protein ATY30_00660 [Sinorhizobium americanum]